MQVKICYTVHIAFKIPPPKGALNLTGIYIHIPFCIRKCPYCAFYSVEYNEELKRQYVSSLIRNIRGYKGRNIPADTVYFGGGTPSLLAPDELEGILSAVKESFLLAPDSEITIEANPSSTDYNKLAAYRKAGANRISFGVQSSNDNELRLLGRLHDFSGARDAVLAAKSAGFENISCDLMIGTPAQTVDSLLASASDIAALGANHISCYMLKIEEGTPYDCERIRNSAADDDSISDMYLALCRELSVLGYHRYEISNFSKPGFESRHNLKYWRLEDYIGFGPSAHSYFAGRRFYVPDSIDEYISSPSQSYVSEDESPDMLEEYVMLSLRLNEGMSLKKLASLGGDKGAVIKKIEPLEDAGLVMLNNDVISLTDSGALVSNGIILEVYLAAIGENQ